jgi:flavin-binding protein dodecin
MTGPFESTPGGQGGLGSRLLGRKARGAAARDIEALLAGSPELAAVTGDRVRAIATEHGLEMSRLQSQCRDLYRRYLEFCLVDRALSDAEVADLTHLREILALPDGVASEVHEEVACAVYGAAVDEVLSDHRLDPDEEVFLQSIRDGLNIDPDSADRTLEEGRRRARQRYLSTVVSSDDILVASQEIKLEIAGSSEESIEGAVSDALVEASTVLPGLKRVELTALEAEIAGGEVGRWHVKLKAVLDKR